MAEKEVLLTLEGLKKLEEEYFIVGSAEADPFANKISNESPVGKAILGQTIGAVIEVEVPEGLLSYQILNIM